VAAALGAVEVVRAGWLSKQGGARGGRKSWKKRWFVLKDECLYYKLSPEVCARLPSLTACCMLALVC
jgi:hypothetical protein